MMFREKSINKLYAFALAAVFALTLAGCGGGGNTAQTTDPEPPTMPEPTAQEMCEGDGGRYNADGSCTSAEALAEEKALKDARDAAMAAYMKAMDYVGMSKDPVAMKNAQMQADMAKGASDMAAAATTSAMAKEHQMKAEMYRDMAKDAAMMRGLGITKLANKITNQSAIDNAVLEGKDPVKPVSNAGRVGTALGVAGMAAAAATEVTASGPGSVSQGGAVIATAKYGASGPTFIVDGTAVTAFDAVKKGESPVTLMTRGDWMGAELVGSDTDSMTYANVYTDIQAPAIKDTYAAADATGSYDVTTLQGHLSNDPEITGDVPVDGSDFAAMYNFNPKDNLPPVTGMFDCPTPAPTNGCSISVKDGVVESIQGYIFRPRTGVGDRKVDDADYLAWGVWLIVPNAAPSTDATTNATAGAFASGNDVFEVKAALTGRATYTGVATGLYSAAGMVEYFDADAMLEANFGGTKEGDNDATTADENDRQLLGVVTGMISNIKAGGMDVDGSLELKRAPVVAATAGTDADPAETTTGFMGKTSGTLAGRTMAGMWGGQFYGPNKATDKGIQTEYPTTAAGTFGAEAPGKGTDQVRILGSFGAWRK